MHRFDASKFLAIATRLAQLNQQMRAGEWVGFPPSELDVLKRDIADIKQQLKEMELDAAEVSATELLAILSAGGDHQPDGTVRFSVRDSDQIRDFSRDTVARARDQLQSRTFLAIPSGMRDFYAQSTPLFGGEVATKFSSVSYEIEEAGKCLALDRSTASAFHSIRCLEAGIRAISRCLGIPDPTRASDRSWSKTLTAIKGELDRRWPGSSNRLSGDGRFFEEAYAALAAMQNPWRNATMHLDQKYTEEESKHVFEVVKGFMIKLASRCDENGDPKA